MFRFFRISIYKDLSSSYIYDLPYFLNVLEHIILLFTSSIFFSNDLRLFKLSLRGLSGLK